ncbi:hypothetical protein L914_18941 [Phytophthora nicotianae]|uniref:RxLR effector protein n=1 Tax=Phytophthora nicotianae TaxID=4792 RepID=W2MC32_PHYNI|nr:hypothetical protein L914_18941 [Phytophthora nicotianae]
MRLTSILSVTVVAICLAACSAAGDFDQAKRLMNDSPVHSHDSTAKRLLDDTYTKNSLAVVSLLHDHDQDSIHHDKLTGRRQLPRNHADLRPGTTAAIIEYFTCLASQMTKRTPEVRGNHP